MSDESTAEATSLQGARGHESSAIRGRVYQYFLDLGYAADELALEAATGGGERVDLLVRRGKEPYIVVEIQSSPTRSVLDPEYLRFDPLVRSLQARATRLRASYYVLTDGSAYLWFRTDKTGRPARLSSPVRQSGGGETDTSRPDKAKLTRLLGSLREFLHESGAEAVDRDIALALAARIKEERTRAGRMSAGLREPGATALDWQALSMIFDESRVVVDSTTLTRAYEAFTPYQFSDIDSRDILGAVDDALLAPAMRRATPRIPRWLASFMVRLARLSADSVVVDPACGYGDILAAAILAQGGDRYAPVWGITSNSDSAFWARLQQFILKAPPENVVVGDALGEGVTSFADRRGLPFPSHVIVAPEFGRRLRSVSQPWLEDFRRRELIRSEEANLLSAIHLLRDNGRAVVLVPEGVLFTDTSRAIREWILGRAHVRAIISLGSGSLLPHSAVKTSLLVLDSIVGDERDVFIGKLDALPGQQGSEAQLQASAGSLASAFEQWDSHYTREMDAAFLVPQRNLDASDLTVHRYVAQIASVDEHSSYPTVRLDHIVQFIRRGTQRRLNEEGRIPVIGPGAIRPMVLDLTRLSRANPDDVPERAILAQSGDVVLNNIGTYVGAAVAVDDAAAGSRVSQHVLLLRPDAAQVMPEYLAAILNSPIVRTQIDVLATGTVIPSLSAKRLGDVLIPLPSRQEQEAVVKSVSEARDAVRVAQEALQRAESTLASVVSGLGPEFEVGAQ